MTWLMTRLSTWFGGLGEAVAHAFPAALIGLGEFESIYSLAWGGQDAARASRTR